MLPTVYAWLAAAAPVTALIGSNPSRCYRHGEAPQGVLRPYVTWFINGIAPEQLVDGKPPPVDGWGASVDAWSDTDAGVEALAQVVRDALESKGYMTGINFDSRDAQTGRYRIGMQFEFWVFR